MLIEAFFILGLSLFGYINIGQSILVGRSSLIKGFISLPLGAALYILCTSIILFFRLPFIPVVLLCTILVEVVIIVVYRKIKREIITGYKQEVPGLTVCILVSAASLIQNFSVLSYDSFAQINLGRTIATAQGLSDVFIHSRLFSWGIGLPSLQSSTVWLGLEYHHSLAFCTLISFAGIFMITLWDQIKISSGITNRALVVICTGAVFSTYFMLFQGFYIHNNLLSAIFLFCFVIFFNSSYEREEGGLRFIGIVFLIAFAMTRLENILIALIFLVPILATWDIRNTERIALSLSFSVPIMLWYGQLGLLGISTSNMETQIANPVRVFLMLGATAVLPLVFALGRNQKVNSLYKYLPGVMTIAILVIVGAISIRYPGKFITSLRNLGINILLGWGNWGIYWYAAAAIFILVFDRKTDRGYAFIGQGVLLSVAMLFFFVGFRAPFRVGWGDSGNRILIHFAPLVLYFLVQRLSIGKINMKAYSWRVFAAVLIVLSFIIFSAKYGVTALVMHITQLRGSRAITDISKAFLERSDTLPGVLLGTALVIVVVIGRIKKANIPRLAFLVCIFLLEYNVFMFSSINSYNTFPIQKKPDNTLLAAITDLELQKYGYNREALMKVKAGIGDRSIKPADIRGVELLNALGARYYPPNRSYQAYISDTPSDEWSFIEVGEGTMVAMGGSNNAARSLILVSQETPQGVQIRLFPEKR